MLAYAPMPRRWKAVGCCSFEAHASILARWVRTSATTRDGGTLGGRLLSGLALVDISHSIEGCQTGPRSDIAILACA